MSWDLLEPSKKAFRILLITAPGARPLNKQFMVGRQAEIKTKLRLIMSQYKRPVRTTLGKSITFSIDWLGALTDFVLPGIKTHWQF